MRMESKYRPGLLLDACNHIVFTVVVSNSGPDPATGVDVTDLLPAGLDFVDATQTQGSYNEDSGLWTVGSLADGADATLTIIATVNTPQMTTNTAEVTGSDQVDPNSENDQDSANVTPQVADLSLTKDADNRAPALAIGTLS